jgi:Arc/MetJ-type ribon-helix-helix transcriptional regulator
VTSMLSQNLLIFLLTLYIQILYTLCMAKTINISLPEELLKKIDEEAKSEYSSRSDYIRDTIVKRLKGQRVVDEWGDDGTWETVINFRELKSSGVSALEVLSAIQDLIK